MKVTKTWPLIKKSQRALATVTPKIQRKNHSDQRVHNVKSPFPMRNSDWSSLKKSQRPGDALHGPHWRSIIRLSKYCPAKMDRHLLHSDWNFTQRVRETKTSIVLRLEDSPKKKKKKRLKWWQMTKRQTCDTADNLFWHISWSPAWTPLVTPVASDWR